MWSNGRSEALVADTGLPVPIEIRPVRNARRLRLRFDEASGTLKLTCPTRTSRKAALAWALDQRQWIESQIARLVPAEPFADGAIIPIEGEDTRIIWSSEESRTPRLVNGELRCGGTEGGLPRRIERYLKENALKTMSAEVREFGDVGGVSATSVTVGDAATRWGSCSSRGAIRLSWRLILAPPPARRYVVAHEVAHLKHLDHSHEFKAFEALLFGPGLAQAKSSLRRVAPRIRRVGRLR